jgi:3-oxoacyl-[acyl-carrier protein] reductase
LASDGWAVGVNYRVGREQAEAVVESIRAQGGEALTVGADVRDLEAPDILCSHLEQELRRPVLVLVNNAGISSDGLLPQLDDESWQAVIDTNLSAAFRLTRRTLRPMLREGYGRIVNIASVIGRRAGPGQAHYAASKAGLIGFTRTVAAEVARRSVTVNAVAPGVIETDATAGTAEALRAAVPARRAGTVEEVAACVRFLASEQASYVTGSVLTVDGGLTA